MRTTVHTLAPRWMRLWFCLLMLGQLLEVMVAVEAKALRITVVYNNVPYTPGMRTAWGFAALVEAGSDSVLFDTGGDGPTLLVNMERLGIEPTRVRAVILSHIHTDHTGGLADFLAHNPRVTVYLPQSFPSAFVWAVEQRGARVETVGGPRRLFAHLHSTGEMSGGTKEQALIIDTSLGLVILTGCAHPDIVQIANAARDYLGKDIYLLMGGFHLLAHNKTEIRQKIHVLTALGVKKVAPSHCTGDEAIALFREAWGSDFIEGGCGAVIEIR